MKKSPFTLPLSIVVLSVSSLLAAGQQPGQPPTIPAAQPELVSDVEVFDRELCVQIYSKSHAITIMMLSPRTIRYEITYRVSKDGVVRSLKSENLNMPHPALLGGCVFLPPLKEGVTVPTKCAEIKIKLPDSDGDNASIQILSWRFIVRASVFDSTDSYEKIFDENKWFSSDVRLRKK